jgi:hypothetical protein
VSEPLDDLERADLHAHVPAPALLILPDSEARVRLDRPLVGRSPVARLILAARAAGFPHVYLAPGTGHEPPGADSVATGDPLGRPALVVYEGSFVHPRLLELMVAHPLDEDERYTLYDDAGRPAAAFVGRLHTVPSLLPITEELPWPEEFGPSDVVRVVYEEDFERAEALVLRAERLVLPDDSAWRRQIELPMVRWMANSRRPLPQLELLALAIAVASLPLALWATHLGLVLSAFALLVGVQASRLLPWVSTLREGKDGRYPPLPERLAVAVRPLGQAAMMGGLTYVIVAQTDRSQVASMVLLAAGAAAALLCLFQARRLLHGKPADVFALPDAHAVATRLGVQWPSALDGSPFLELAVVIAAIPGVHELPWSILAAGAVARLWRWFAGAGGPIEDAAPTLDVDHS